MGQIENFNAYKKCAEKCCDTDYNFYYPVQICGLEILIPLCEEHYNKLIRWHCNKHVDWVDFEADHRPNPHSKGGKTSVENGVCAHKICNIKASNKENLTKNWLS